MKIRNKDLALVKSLKRIDDMLIISNKELRIQDQQIHGKKKYEELETI